MGKSLVLLTSEGLEALLEFRKSFSDALSVLERQRTVES